ITIDLIQRRVRSITIRLSISPITLRCTYSVAELILRHGGERRVRLISSRRGDFERVQSGFVALARRTNRRNLKLVDSRCGDVVDIVRPAFAAVACELGIADFLSVNHDLKARDRLSWPTGK